MRQEQFKFTYASEVPLAATTNSSGSFSMPTSKVTLKYSELDTCLQMIRKNVTSIFYGFEKKNVKSIIVNSNTEEN